MADSDLDAASAFVTLVAMLSDFGPACDPDQPRRISAFSDDCGELAEVI